MTLTGRTLLRGLVLAALMLTAAGAFAQPGARSTQPQAPATVKGRIFDDETGESMPYTNVFISGTNIGTMAFTDGFYIIRGLQPGTYTIKASYISYGVGSQTVTLEAGEILNLDFRLEVQAIMAEPFDVAAERALIEVDRTGSTHYITSDQMEAMPLDQVVDMIAQTPGVTIQDNEIHIRGGRADDTMFVVDGMNVNDPLAGGGYGYSIDPSMINEIEVLTGGFNAEYGQAVSGVVKVSTKEGSSRVEGRLSLKRDYLFETHDKTVYPGYENLTDYTDPKNIDIIKASVSGPDPISAGLRALGIDLPGEQFILAGLSLDTRDGYLPIYSRTQKLQSPIYTGNFWAPRQDNNWNGLLKWTWNFTPHHKLNINLSRNVGIGPGLRPAGRRLSAGLHGQPGQLAGVHHREHPEPGLLSPGPERQLVVRGHPGAQLQPDAQQPERQRRLPVLRPAARTSRRLPDDGQRTFHADRWHDHYSESYTLKTAYSFMGIGNNKFKTGFDLSFTEMQLIDLQNSLGQPPAGKLAIYEDIFKANPVTGAAYFQDTLEYRGLIVNAGVRLDFWAPGREVERVMESPDDYLFITEDMADRVLRQHLLGRSARAGRPGCRRGWASASR